MEKQKSILVPNVNLFEGHIACNSNSKSELVCPIIVNNKVVCILDADSNKINGFDLTDQKTFELICSEIASLFLHRNISFGCAEVGLITGGNKDNTAPKPVKINPEFGTTNFDVSEIEFEFDEYLKLNDPSSTILLSPNNSKTKASSKGKTVTITFLDSLEENTTYQLQLNKTIKDITEGNDSLITYVFSTGQFLDSLNYKIQVIDAYSNKPVKNVNVGLFRENDSINPFYFKKNKYNGHCKF